MGHDARGPLTVRPGRADGARSWALIATAVICTGAALLSNLYNVENILFRLGWNPGPGQLGLTALPGALLPAVVLLVAGLCAFPAQRPRRLAPQ